ncbi:MAG TPA: hotdog fold thioesterase [Symbiobacteriaceae bacterium]|nr:hotdog fold thioesterase [Symbiobacteriaceae bacterium]
MGEQEDRDPQTLVETLGIELIETSPERVVATMPVDGRTRQPYGILHGGASVALAETVASIGAVLNAGEGRTAVGLEINANHIRPKRSGVVRAEALPLHVGRSTSVWEIKITDEAGKLVCVSRCTLAFVPV